MKIKNNVKQRIKKEKMETKLNYDVQQSSSSICFDEAVYSNLPEYMAKILKQYPNKRQKDIVLLAMLTSFSAILTNVFGNYGGSKINPNVFVFIVAPPASGKGSMLISLKILAKVFGFVKAQNIQNNKEYAIALDHHNKYKQGAKPRKPKEIAIHLPANVYSTAFIELISNSKNGIIIESEADVIVKVWHSIAGSCSEIWRSIYSNEKVSYYRKKDAELVEVENARLSVLVSGTINQILNLFKSAEDGLFSRCLFYHFDEVPQFNEPFELDNTEKNGLVEDLSNLVLSIYNSSLQGNERIFSLSKTQQELFNTHFKIELDEYTEFEGSDGAGLIIRGALNTFKIAMILTAIKNTENENLVCSDDDFNTAMKISEHLINCGKTIYNLLPEQRSNSQTMCVTPSEVFNDLPPIFLTHHFKAIVENKFGKSGRTAERLLRELLITKKIKKLKQGEYQTITSQF